MPSGSPNPHFPIRNRYGPGTPNRGVPEVGERLIGEIVTSIEALATHPDMGRSVPEFEQPVLRELIRPPFRLVYRRDPKQVRVVRVWRRERLLDVPDKGAR